MYLKRNKWKLISSLGLALAVAVTIFLLAREELVSTAGNAEETFQCAHWAAHRCCQLLGVPASRSEIGAKLPSRDGGHSLDQLISLLADLGVEGKGYRESWETLKKTDSFPIVAHLKNPNHYVVVSGIEADLGYVHVYDGEGERVRLDQERFLSRWTGVTLHVNKSKQAHRTNVVQFERLLVDKGDIAMTGQATEFAFPFRNLGKDELLIEQVNVNCSCLKAEYPQSPIPPGETGTIKLFFNIFARSGPLYQTAVVVSSKSQPISIVAAGYTGVEAFLAPAAINVNFVEGKERKIPLYLNYNGRWEDLEVIDIKAELKNAVMRQGGARVVNKADLVDSESNLSARQGKDRSQVMDLLIQPTGKSGDLVSGFISLMTSHRDYPLFRVDVQSSIVSSVRAMPEYVVFRSDQDQNVQETVRLISQDNSGFRVLSVSADGQELSGDCYSVNYESYGADLAFSLRVPDAVELSGKNVLVKIQGEDDDQTHQCLVRFFAR